MSEDGVPGEVQQIIDAAADRAFAEQMAKMFLRVTSVAVLTAATPLQDISLAADVVRCTVADRQVIVDDIPVEQAPISRMARAVVREYVEYIGRLADIMADWPEDAVVTQFVTYVNAIRQATAKVMADGPFRDEGGLA